MAKFVISYDLLAPGRNYDALWAELRRLQTKQVLYSQWAGRINGTAAQLRDHLRQFVDANDRILVMDADGPDWAGYNLLARLDQM
jgi:membrane glycosyltransferase